jgi:ankyrin repeat protein
MAKADVNKASSSGESPYQMARRKGFNKLATLMSASADTKQRSDAKKIAHWEAISKKAAKKLFTYFGEISSQKNRALIERQIREHEDLIVMGILDLSTARTPNTDTFLHLAASACASDIVGLLIEMRCNPNVKTSDGRTPLHHACEQFQKGNPEAQNTIQKLLSKNADMALGDFDSGKQASIRERLDIDIH